MTILRSEPRPTRRRQDHEEKTTAPVAPVALLAVREALHEAFAHAVDDVRLAEVDGTVHVYVSVAPAPSAAPERIRAAAREAYRRAVRGGPGAVAHVAVAGRGRADC
ncbi:hypothetical protein ACFOWE_02905 [Planomonospora corallina]|uniref:Uncharacterized protein n=1 Tax=Planomonospora corallina TaxID=1806052 RepID=A0ABV8I5K6_9ACTN